MLTISWTTRPILPNRLGMITDDKEKLGAWSNYRGALDKISSYCNNKGIITKENKLTKAKYLEVYSWEQLLKNNNDETLNEARSMQEAGYLDCYVLVTCFHQDFYEQYLDFAKNNKERIIKYYNAFLK